MDKCKWKDGKFEACEGMKNAIEIDNWDFQSEHIKIINKGKMTVHGWCYNFCPFCGADIRKSKEKKDPNDWPKEKWMAFYNAVKPFMEKK